MRKLNSIDKTIVYKHFNDYKKQYNQHELHIDNIVMAENKSYWAEFVVKELYNKNYTLYINEKLTQMNERFIRCVLFHEFTHLADSYQFADAEYIVFKYIMYTYSECHASEVELIQKIKLINEPISIQSKMYTGETLKEFMDNQLSDVKYDIERAINYNEAINIRSLYYFCGYLKALEEYKITYTYNIHFQENLLTDYCNNIIKIMMYQHSVSQITKSYINFRDYVLKLRRLPKCPVCFSTRIRKISGLLNVKNVVKFCLLLQKSKHQLECENCGYEW